MRQIYTNDLSVHIKKLIAKTCINLPSDVLTCIQNCKTNETSEVAKKVLNQIEENANIAKAEKLPLCQDTGFAVFFVDIGQEIQIIGDDITKTINNCVKEAYKENFFRNSIVKDPITRKNTNDNTPAIIHYNIVPGNNIKITFCPKGGGSENMSKIAMLSPGDGWQGIENFVLDTVKNAGANPCPPIIVGIGIGGTFDYVPILAKKALLKNIIESNKDSFYSQKEQKLLKKINELNIGPAGLGGNTTALAVKINTHPCHIASLPVAINIQCHSARHKQIII
jgi:fumarate hydratase subunit alpha